MIYIKVFYIFIYCSNLYTQISRDSYLNLSWFFFFFFDIFKFWEEKKRFKNPDFVFVFQSTNFNSTLHHI